MGFSETPLFFLPHIPVLLLSCRGDAILVGAHRGAVRQDRNMFNVEKDVADQRGRL